MRALSKKKQPPSWRTLIRKPMTARDTDWLFSNAPQMSDQALALYLATLIERLLEQAIASRMRILTRREFGQMFISGPLASFEAKIKIGHALSLYGKDTVKDLDRMREIRNAFAHSLHNLRFSSKRITKYTAGFKSLRYRDLFRPLVKEFGGKDYPKNAREAYHYTFFVIMVGLVNLIEKPKRPRLSHDWFSQQHFR